MSLSGTDSLVETAVCEDHVLSAWQQRLFTSEWLGLSSACRSASPASLNAALPGWPQRSPSQQPSTLRDTWETLQICNFEFSWRELGVQKQCAAAGGGEGGSNTSAT